MCAIVCLCAICGCHCVCIVFVNVAKPHPRTSISKLNLDFMLSTAVQTIRIYQINEFNYSSIPSCIQPNFVVYIILFVPIKCLPNTFIYIFSRYYQYNLSRSMFDSPIFIVQIITVLRVLKAKKQERKVRIPPFSQLIIHCRIQSKKINKSRTYFMASKDPYSLGYTQTPTTKCHKRMKKLSKLRLKKPIRKISSWFCLRFILFFLLYLFFIRVDSLESKQFQF